MFVQVPECTADGTSHLTDPCTYTTAKVTTARVGLAITAARVATARVTAARVTAARITAAGVTLLTAWFHILTQNEAGESFAPHRRGNDFVRPPFLEEVAVRTLLAHSANV